MRDWRSLFSTGRCKGCRRQRSLYKGSCLPCRQPEDRRELVEYGVPPNSADALALIMEKCNGVAGFVLGKVHPRLMENITVVNGTLKVRDKTYGWVRRNGWVKARR